MIDPNRRFDDGASGDDATIVLAERIRRLHADVGEMRGDMRALVQAVTKLTIIEERQMNAGESIRRAFDMIESVSARVGELEAAQPAARNAHTWVERAVIALVAAALMFVAKQTGLI